MPLLYPEIFIPSILVLIRPYSFSCFLKERPIHWSENNAKPTNDSSSYFILYCLLHSHTTRMPSILYDHHHLLPSNLFLKPTLLEKLYLYPPASDSSISSVARLPACSVYLKRSSFRSLSLSHNALISYYSTKFPPRCILHLSSTYFLLLPLHKYTNKHLTLIYLPQTAHSNLPSSWRLWWTFPSAQGEPSFESTSAPFAAQ